MNDNEWIDVNDKLPATYTTVIACNQNGIDQDERDCFIAGYDDTGWHEQWGDSAEVTHWQPLPELPKK